MQMLVAPALLALAAVAQQGLVVVELWVLVARMVRVAPALLALVAVAQRGLVAAEQLARVAVARETAFCQTMKRTVIFFQAKKEALWA